MSLYAINQRVWCKSHKHLGTVTEANYVGKPRRAQYVIDFGNGYDWLCGPSDLRAADWCCELCNRYLPGRPYRTAADAPDGDPTGLKFCFLCMRDNRY